MIHIIGTCHKTQILTDLIKKKALGAPPFAKLQEFRAYLEEVATNLQVIAIGEEMSADRVVAYGHNAVSIAASAAGKLNLAHIFCEPDGDDRRQLGLRAGQEMVDHANEIARQQGRDLKEVHREEVRKQFTTRELFWVSRLDPFYSKGSVLFICGADHAATFPVVLVNRGFIAPIGPRRLASPVLAVSKIKLDGAGTRGCCFAKNTYSIHQPGGRSCAALT